MNPAMLQNFLAQAERHVAMAEEHVRSQATLIQKLERAGDDTTLAKRLLAQIERLLAWHYLDRYRLRNLLGLPPR